MKKGISFLLILVLIVSVLSGCTNSREEEIIIDEPPVPGPAPITEEGPVVLSEDEENSEETISMDIRHFGDGKESPKKEKDEERINALKDKWKTELKKKPDNLSALDFETSLIDYTLINGFNHSNFMISPLSLKLALVLAIEGAEGSTKEELINAIGFKSYEEMQEWYSNVLKSLEMFESNPEKQSSWAYKVANSAWANTDYISEFSSDYILSVSQNYKADIRNKSANEINNAVDKWIKDATNGFIDGLKVDLSIVPATLINALYLKSGWVNAFNTYNTVTDNFLTIDGKIVKKDFMTQTKEFLYYEDDFTQLVVLPLGGGVKAVFVLGSTNNIREKLAQAEKRNVYVYLPKFEINSRFEDYFFIKYFEAIGYTLPFSNEADFSRMIDEGHGGFCIDDIIQVTRIKTDEEGLEAAAVTAVITKNVAYIESPEKVEFIADNPFSFYILDSNNNDELLFYGQVVE